MSAPEPDPVEWVRDRWADHGLPDAERFAAVAALMRTHRVVTGGVQDALRDEDLNLTAYLLLVTLLLSDDGSRRLSYLARYLIVHQTTVTQLVDSLERRGLLERRAHPSDRRTTLAVITDDGRALVRRATAAASSGGFGLGETTSGGVERLGSALRQVRRATGDL